MTSKAHPPPRVLVCGGRDFADYEMLSEALDALMPVAVIIHGGAKGADRLAGQYAESHQIEQWAFPALWEKYGKGAGPVRNAQMLREGKPEIVIAFPGGKGTANMVKLAREAGVPVVNVVGVVQRDRSDTP